MLFRKLLLCVAALGAGGTAHAVPVQTTYSYVGTDYTYRPLSQLEIGDETYPKPGTDYAAILGSRLTATITIDGDTSAGTGLYSTGRDYNPPGYREIIQVSFSSGQVTFSPNMFVNTPLSVTLIDGAITQWSYFSNFGNVRACGVGPFCDPGFLNLSPLVGNDLRFYIPYPGANWGAQSIGLGTWSLVSVSPVPVPILGTGLPGVLIAIAGFIAWRHNRRAPRDEGPFVAFAEDLIFVNPPHE